MKKFLLLILFTSFFFNSYSKDFRVNQGECQLLTDIASEHQVVNTALEMLKNDWNAVFGKAFSTSAQSRIIVGTVNHSNALKGVEVDFKCLKGKTQAFLLVVTKDGDAPFKYMVAALPAAPLSSSPTACKSLPAIYDSLTTHIRDDSS